MEQKKLLWIILAVSLFLLMVLGVGLVWMTPDSQGSVVQTPVEEYNQQNEPDIIRTVRESTEYPGLMSETGETGDIYFSEEPVYGQTRQSGEIENQTSSVPVQQQPVVQTQTVRGNPGVTPPEPEPAPVQVVETARPAPAPARSAVIKTPSGPQYWIQAGSFRNIYSANQIREQLIDTGFASVVVATKTIDNNEYYRVRIGPYLTISDARSFLSRVKNLDGYSESYIAEVF